MDDRSSGKPCREVDFQSGQEELYRINLQTGKRETLVQGGVGPYWSEDEYVIRDKWGMDIDLG